jgi:hypothetical protein
MHMLSVTAALALSVIAGVLTTSAFFIPDSAARASFRPSDSLGPCANTETRVYIDALGEPVAIGCLQPLNRLDSQVSDLQQPAPELLR